MRIYDFTPLKNNDTEYRRLAENILECYKCDWDDKIHDSYLKYVKQVQERSQKVHDIRRKIETLEKEVENLKIEDFQRRAEDLCREADSV